MTPEFMGIIALLGSVIALAVALFGTLKWLADRMDKQFDRMDKQFDRMDKQFDRIDDRFERVDDRFERVESELSKLKEGLSGVKEGQARLAGMFEGAFERVPRARPGNGGEEGGAVSSSSGRSVER